MRHAAPTSNGQMTQSVQRVSLKQCLANIRRAGPRHGNDSKRRIVRLACTTWTCTTAVHVQSWICTSSQ